METSATTSSPPLGGTLPSANLSAYDATYVALAEALDCRLVIAYARLSRAPGSRCPIPLLSA